MKSMHGNIHPYNSVEPETTANLKQIPFIGSVMMSAEALEAFYWLKTKRAAADILITAIYSLFPYLTREMSSHLRQMNCVWMVGRLI